MPSFGKKNKVINIYLKTMIILINRKTAYKSRWYEKLYDKFWSIKWYKKKKYSAWKQIISITVCCMRAPFPVNICCWCA